MSPLQALPDPEGLKDRKANRGNKARRGRPAFVGSSGLLVLLVPLALLVIRALPDRADLKALQDRLVHQVFLARMVTTGLVVYKDHKVSVVRKGSPGLTVVQVLKAYPAHKAHRVRKGHKG